MDDTLKRKFTIRNSVSGGGWFIGALEDDLRAYCLAKGLKIEVFKSGWIFKHMSFVISGTATTPDVYSYVDDLSQIYLKHGA